VSRALAAQVTGVTRTVLREQIKDVLVERILRGSYLPGDRLVETAIARELGVSQAPVREALRDLETLRLIESEPFRGARVRRATPAEIAEIYPVRAALEEVAARGAATRLADTSALEAELDAMHSAALEGDAHRLVEHDVAFHRLIVEASGNRTLLEVWDSLAIPSRTIITLFRARIALLDIVELHRPLVEALSDRDAARAGAEARSHVERFGDLILKGESP
jgi:DNA-binding GntR family transcriptional regulator